MARIRMIYASGIQEKSKERSDLYDISDKAKRIRRTSFGKGVRMKSLRTTRGLSKAKFGTNKFGHYRIFIFLIPRMVRSKNACLKRIDYMARPRNCLVKYGIPYFYIRPETRFLRMRSFSRKMPSLSRRRKIIHDKNKSKK